MAKNKNNKTHYEVLNLKEDCSAQDIRNAFVNLSKSCHPDANPGDKNLHDRFIDINEAYSVLSKPQQRRNYDLTLSLSRRQGRRIDVSGMPAGGESRQTIRRDPSIWEMRDRAYDRPIDPDSYYGIKGIRRIGNGWIFAGACVFMLVGSMLHYGTLRSNSQTTVQKLNEKDRTLGMKLFLARQTAAQNGNDRQLEIMQEKWANVEETRKY